MSTTEADTRSYNIQSDSPRLYPDGFEELAVQDLSWVVNTPSRYGSILHKLPGIFAWEESRDPLANLQVFARSVALRRLRSSLDHIGRYDPGLAKSMRATFEELPLEGKLRFMTAPETFHRIMRLRKEPVDAIIALCNFLNGEAALHGLGPIDKDYVTALGDFYYSDDERGDDAPARAVHAPRLAGSIPIDFDSPNVANAQEGDEKKEYLRYSAEEKALICEKLEDAFGRIERVSEAAAHLIKNHIKVIIPLNSVESGTGSTSQSHYPGRVLLRHVEVCGPATLTTSLVHEAMHQVMYILEWGGTFIVDDPDAREVRVTSGWTGRDLPLHSYIHACYVWYGLSTFWGLARSSEIFKPSAVEGQLVRSLAGFKDENPAGRLAPYAGMVRYDVLKVAGTLRDRLEGVM